MMGGLQLQGYVLSDLGVPGDSVALSCREEPFSCLFTVHSVASQW